MEIIGKRVPVTGDRRVSVATWSMPWLRGVRWRYLLAPIKGIKASKPFSILTTGR